MCARDGDQAPPSYPFISQIVKTKFFFPVFMLGDITLYFQKEDRSASSLRRSLNSCSNAKFGGAPVTIWNPAIRNHVDLPQYVVNQNEVHIATLGFGVASNVYKVVRLVYCRNYNNGFIAPPHAEIFSLGTRRWRRLSGIDVRARVLNYMSPSIFLKGFVHWKAHMPTSENGHLILRFHVGDEVFDETMLPDELERAELGSSLNLAIMGESLGAIKCDGHMGNGRWEVWMMKDYGLKESWTKLYRIEFNRMYRVIGFWEGGEALLDVERRELFSYNAETKGIKHVEVFGDCKKSTRSSFYVDYYKESLILLGELGEGLSLSAASTIES